MYLSMVRISLMIPYASSEFDPTIDGFRITIKWDNNVQNIKGSYVFPIFKYSWPWMLTYTLYLAVLAEIPISSVGQTWSLVLSSFPLLN